MNPQFLSKTNVVLSAALTLAVILIGVYGGLRTSKMSSENPRITTLGLPEISVAIQVAYPGKSWQEVVLTNSGEHHLVAAVLVYELTKEDGSKGYARDVICDPGVSAESDPVKLKELLIRTPVIPPQSSWLVGVGIDRTRLSKGLPSFEESRHLVFQKLVENPPPIKSIHITLDAVILEDGRVVGPQRDNPKQLILDVVKKFNQELL